MVTRAAWTGAVQVAWFIAQTDAWTSACPNALHVAFRIALSVACFIAVRIARQDVSCAACHAIGFAAADWTDFRRGHLIDTSSAGVILKSVAAPQTGAPKGDRMKKLVLVMSVFLVSAFGQEFIQNGDFEDSLAFWDVTYNSPQGTWGAVVNPAYDPDPDYELCVYKNYRYSTTVSQTVDVPSAHLRFAGSAKLHAVVGTKINYYAYATINLEYRDSTDVLLGRTMIVKKTPYCTLESSSTQHLIVVTSGDWEDYEFHIDRELENLPDVDAADVRKITVVLEAYGTGATG